VHTETEREIGVGAYGCMNDKTSPDQKLHLQGIFEVISYCCKGMVLIYLFVSVLVSVPSMCISNVVKSPSEIHPVSVSLDKVRNVRRLYS